MRLPTNFLVIGVITLTLASSTYSQPMEGSGKIKIRRSSGSIEMLLGTLRLPQTQGLPPMGNDCSADPKVDDCSTTVVLLKGSIEYKPDDNAGTTPISKPICVAIGHDVRVIGVPDTDKKISPKKVNYTFDAKSSSEILSPTFVDARIHKGADQHKGTYYSADYKKMTILTKRQKKQPDIEFLPVIKWNNGGDWDLCAAIDPKIVNVQ